MTATSALIVFSVPLYSGNRCIIQGLPRIKELLEDRKPKEACILAKEPGTDRVVTDDDVVELAVIEDDGRIEEYPF